jgi:glycosyltransferase involved in cell wall biosynthesis
MDVDVGIAVWGHSPYLRSAIASVEHQTLTRWRLHISQDGPARSSVSELVAAIGDSRISYSATGNPVGASRNKTGLLRSGEGPYVTLLDHDDVWDPDFLRRRIEFLEAHPDCAFVFSPLTVMDADGTIVERAPPLLADGVYASKDMVPALLEADGIPGGSVVLRRSALREIGDCFSESLPRTYDYELWMRLALRFPVGYVGLWDVRWRRHPLNASTTDLRGYEEEYERLVSRLSVMFARERPELRPGPGAWRRKLSALLLLTSLEALRIGQRRLAWRYLSQAVLRGRREALTRRTLTVALTVALGPPGVGLVAMARRLHRSRIRRALRKLVRDPAGFTALAGDRLTRHSRAVAADPVESLIMLRERVADRDELRGKRTSGGGVMPWPPCPYAADEDWEARLHELLGAPWPCPAQREFSRLWDEVMLDLQASKGLRLGRGAFAGWGDGEPGLARAVWCLTHHLRPEKVVETGVARGITTRFLLEALERHGRGHLWSVDLPPPLDRELHPQIGIAVPETRHTPRTYVRGASRRRLPALLTRVGPIDLFIHDSAHTARNVIFELSHAWEALAVGGVVVADDVDMNCGFHQFEHEHGQHPSLVCHAEPLVPDPLRQDQRGVFALVRKISVTR